MPPTDISSTKDVGESAAATTTNAAQFSLSNSEMEQFGNLFGDDRNTIPPMLPEFHIDTTDIYAPPVIQMANPVDCSRYTVEAVDPNDDQLVKDLIGANQDASLAKVQVTFQDDYSKAAFDKFSTDGSLDMSSLVDKFNSDPALTDPEYHGGHFLANNYDLLKSADGLIHKEGLTSWYDQTIQTINNANAHYQREVLECINNDF